MAGAEEQAGQVGRDQAHEADGSDYGHCRCGEHAGQGEADESLPADGQPHAACFLIAEGGRIQGSAHQRGGQ